MKQISNKTNVIKILEQKKVKFESYCYANIDTVSGIAIANALERNPNQIIKTLVTVGKTKENYVFLIPINKD